MSIGNSFESALMKAIRGAELKTETLYHKEVAAIDDIEKKLYDLDDLRIFTVYEALVRGISIERINEITRIDKWFLSRIKNIVDYEKSIRGNLSAELYEKGKKLGFTDKALESISGCPVPMHQSCVYKMVDTCGGEFAAKTPYFYSTYDKNCEARAVSTDNKKVIVLGSGPIRIGQGIEFDYSSVHCVWALKEMGYEVIIINNNPETVSTACPQCQSL